MSDVFHRDIGSDWEIRSETDEGRIVHGICVPFDVPSTIREFGVEYEEVFRRGAFADTIRERGDRVKLLKSHDRNVLPVGRAISLREDRVGLIGEFLIPRTSDGEEVLEKIRTRTVDTFSIGFIPVTPNQRYRPRQGETVERTAVKLMEVSVVTFGAHPKSQIVGVRSDDTDLGPDQPDAADHGIAPDQRIHRARATALLDLDNFLKGLRHEAH